MVVVMATTIAASLEGEQDYEQHRYMEMLTLPPYEPGILEQVPVVSHKEEVDAPPTLGSTEEPTPEQTKQADEPEPAYIPTEQAPTHEAGSAEGIICTIWGGSLPCGYVLAVARCESGPDYYVGPGEGYYIGTFQLDPELHGWRFRQHGWDIGTDGTDIYKNSVVAYELYKEQGMSPWPVCRYV